MKKHIISFCMSLVMALFAMPALAQEQQVTGSVVDESGEPIIGASVIVEGTKNGVITDLDGNYKLTVAKGQKITVTYIGYVSQTVTPGGKLVLREDNAKLDEVVVVGYGTQKKSHLTGSVATVPMDDVLDISSGDLASTLRGLVPGLSVSGGQARPGTRASLYIRDASGVSAVGSTAQEPLFVIDGYIYPNDIKVGNGQQNLGAEAFNNLDPNEIESISVLKDAAAAVYGARAANGVILVTTKKGKLGQPRISYSGTFGFADEATRPDMLSAYDYGRLYNAVAAADPRNTSLNHTTGLYQLDELEAMKSLNYDLLDKYWETAITQKHGVNVSGATDKVSYFAGISYFTQDGNLGRLDYDRWNYRAGIDVKVTNFLSANLNVSGDYGSQEKPNVKVGGSNDENDYRTLLTRPRYLPEQVGGYDIAYYGISGTKTDDSQEYPFSVLQNNGDYRKTMTANMTINGSLEYDFGWSKALKGLKLKFIYAKSINTQKSNEYASDYTIYRMVNRSGSGSHLYTPVAGTDYDALLDDSNFRALTRANGSLSYLSRNMPRTDNYQINFTVNYSRDFGMHHLNGLFSIEKSETEMEYLYGYVDQPYAFTTHQSNSAVGDSKTTTFTRSEAGSLSYIGRINYAYANKYLFEFLLRADASTKFAPENMWGYFPSVSAGWAMSEEDWFQKAFPWVDFFKIRASFGLTGRDNTAAWQWMQVYAQDANRGMVFGEGTNQNSGNRITINKNNSAVNREVHWDKSYKTNIGFDMSFFNKRLNANLDLYRNFDREMLINYNQSIPATVGTQSAALNKGEMDSYGFELGLTWRDRIGEDIKYHIGINTGWSDDKIIERDWPNQFSYRAVKPNGSSDSGTWALQCIGMFRSFQDIEEYFDQYNITSYLGMSKDQVRPGMLIYKDVRGKQLTDGTYEGPDGIVNEDDDQVRISDHSNRYGVTTNFGIEWKGLSLQGQISGSWGGYTVLPTSALKPGSGIEFTNMPAFWNPDDMYVYEDIRDGAGNVVVSKNQEAKYPNLAYSSVNAIASTFWRVSAARVRLNRLTLAYRIPSEITKRLGVQSARINITGQNLIDFYNPYPDNFMATWSGYGSYPALRKWTVGLNLSF